MVGVAMVIAIMYFMLRELGAQMKWKTMHANMYYPGRQFIRSFGEPLDWEKDDWWWQRPLESFPNQGQVWWFENSRYKYINYLKKVEEEERVAAELAAESE